MINTVIIRMGDDRGNLQHPCHLMLYQGMTTQDTAALQIGTVFRCRLSIMMSIARDAMVMGHHPLL